MKTVSKETGIEINEIHKIQLNVSLLTNGKTIPLCQEEIFISDKKSYEGVKIKFNQNLTMMYSAKKVGYILFNFAYKTEEFTQNVLNDASSAIYKNFLETEKTIKFVEEPLLLYKYYGIPNYHIKSNGLESSKIELSNFTSIGDLEESNKSLILADFGGELQNEGLSLTRLLELFEISKYSYDFYMVLKRIFDHTSNTEFSVNSQSNRILFLSNLKRKCS